MIKNRLLIYTIFVVITSSGLLYAIYSEFSFLNNNSFAQISNTSSIADNISALSNTSDFVQFNNYENNDLGISLKYPSNFLVDESNSNETLKQISFFPVDNATMNPENNIQWIGVFVENLDSNPQSLSSSFNYSSSTPLSSSSSSSNSDIGTYLENLANSIQQENQDVTIIEASTNASLSGHPAYKLVTESYYDNYTIIDIEIGTITDNKLYSLNYEVDPLNYQNSIPTANVIIESFKIHPITSAGDFNLEQQLLDSKSTILPLLGNILSSLKMDNLSNDSSSFINTLNNSLSNSVNNILTNTTTKINESLMNTSSPSSLPSSSSDTLEKICNIPLISKLCGRDTMTGFQSDNNASFLRNGTDDSSSTSGSGSSAIEKKIKNLFGFLDFSDNSTKGLTNMSEFNKLMGPLNSLSQSSQPPNLSSLFSSVDPRTNNNFLNLTESESIANQYINNGTKDVLKMLDFLQGR
ncbi:MAG: hypothetical protein H0X03_05325 [Nitrosopumilus sp.]|nr:hypothetical protein [Nitrosopumilus sp.]